MGLFDGGNSYSMSQEFLNHMGTLAEAAKTAAEAYADKTKQPNIVVNVAYEPSINNVQDVANAVLRAVRTQDR
jgi:hypothetical protein